MKVASITITVALLLTLSAPAGAAAPTWVPADLEPWIPWVTEGEEYRRCPFFMNTRAGDRSDFRCAWPGRLRIEVDSAGGSFSQAWTVLAEEQWIALPGDERNWPMEVQVDERPVALFRHDGRPAIRLGPGEHRLRGRFRWQELPRMLAIPQVTGLVSLAVEGADVERPQRSAQGLYLGQTRQADRVEDSLEMRVYRLAEDDVPTLLTTRLQLEVAGAIREVMLGPVLPAGFVPQSLVAPMPGRVEADGRLRLQLSPGSWSLELVSHADDLVDEIPRPAAGPDWPATEIWSYRADDRLRVAVPAGMTPVDPSQVGVPAPWAALPAFSLEGGETFRLEERRRGGMTADNRLSLQRGLWLDFDGKGMTAVDSLSGEMHRRWRLSLAAPYELEGARDDEGQPLLVTRDPDQETAGFEWREVGVALQAVSRLPAQAVIPASGWSERLTGLSATLHLPPGYRLLAAPGADRAPGAWLDRWSLLDLFVVLLTAAAAGRLFGRGTGLLALATLVLVHQDLSVFSWLALNLTAAIALSRAAPEGRLRSVSNWYRRASLAALVLLAVPFAIQQIKLTLYPQLESYSAYAPEAVADIGVGVAGRKLQQAAESRLAATPEEAAADRAVRMPASVSPYGQAPARYAPGDPVQTGPGLPSWRWNSYRLSWSGPVEPLQSLRLVILPRWVVALWRMAMVGLALLLIWYLGRDALTALGRLRLPASGSVAILALAVTLGAGMPSDSRAELPSAELLGELKQRLTRVPDCVPDCGHVDSVEALIAPDRLQLVLRVNALGNIAVPLPGSEASWMPDSVSVDGAAAGRLFRDASGVLWLPLDSGRHRIDLAGRLPSVDKLQIAFPVVPAAVTVQAEGWSVTGLEGRRLVAGALELTRQRESGEEAIASAWDGTRFPDFLRLERTVALGLEWTVTTELRRVAPTKGSITVDIPLLPGEAVTTDGIAVADGNVRAGLSPEQQAVRWRSSLQKDSELTLTAPAPDASWVERWRFEISGIWHASLEGVPAYTGGDVRWSPLYLPRPGEALTVSITRPPALEGDVLAVDRVELAANFGSRATETRLDFHYRSSLGGPHTILLPPESELLSLSQDGRTLPLPAAGGKVRIPALPGAHQVSLSWREANPMGLRSQTPAVNLNAPASNISVSASLPGNRWTMMTAGPSIGPAVLYWSELAALALLALVLGRIRLTPLRSRHWFLLGLGFSTFAWPAFGLVVVWLLVMGWRGRWPEEMPDQRFETLQSLVGLLSVAALIGLVLSIPLGLLGTPDMHVVGNGSYGNQLNWFADRVNGELPVAGAVTLPLWIYKIAILVWALWLSFALLRWLPWAWRCFNHGGIWRGRIKRS